HPNVPVVQGLPAVPAKNFSSPPFSNRAWLAVGSWKGWALVTAGRNEKLQIPNPKLQKTPKSQAPKPSQAATLVLGVGGFLPRVTMWIICPAPSWRRG